MKNIVALLLLSFVLFSCFNDKGKPPTAANVVTTPIEEIIIENNKESDLIKASNRAIKLLKNKNFEAFSQLIHPTLGIRFSPTAFIDVHTDLTFDITDFKTLITQKDSLVWGVHKQSGDNIELNFNDYYSTYIYDADYLNAESITENTCLKNGSIINNISEIYSGAEFVEYYFSGFNKEYDGLDWKAIRLVFKKQNDKYHIVALVHN